MVSQPQVSMTIMAAEVARMNIIEPMKKRSSPGAVAKGGQGSAMATVPRKSQDKESKEASKSKDSLALHKRLSFHVPWFFGSDGKDRSESFHSLAELAGRQDEHFQYDLSQFEIKKQIGSGAFGKVHLCTHKKTGEKVVLKMVGKQFVVESGQLEHIKHEIDNMAKLASASCPFVARTLGTFQDETNIYFVIEYVSGGELFSHLKSAKKKYFSEKKARFYVAELIVALEYMHERANIIYRDLKPENVLLDPDGHIKVIDFGFSKYVDRDAMTFTFCGTPDYLAPEIIEGRGHNKLADYWGLGVFTYELVCGYPPFVTQDSQGNPIYDAILKGAYGFPKHLSVETKELIAGLLTVDPERRLGVKNGIDDIKAQAWFADIAWSQLAKKQVAPPKPGKFKKGLVNIQNKSMTSMGSMTEIDQSLFEEFDTVVRAEGGTIVARRVSHTLRDSMDDTQMNEGSTDIESGDSQQEEP